MADKFITSGKGAVNLTARQEAFCREYAVCLNATKAATAAKFSEKTARQQGQRMLSNVAILNRIADLQRPALEEYAVSLDRVLREVALIAFSNLHDFLKIDDAGIPAVDLSRATSEQLRALKHIDAGNCNQQGLAGQGNVRIALHDKIGALSVLLRRFDLGRSQTRCPEPPDMFVAE